MSKTATIRARVTVEIPLSGGFGDEWPLGKVRQEAIEAARHAVLGAFEGRARVIDVKPIVVFVEDGQ